MMLQWTGGSRRKVTNSRKSTQNRQKQYFEQRKRQQQTPGLESYADGRNKCSQYHEESRSLDILSLINLATNAQECSLGCTIVREGPDVYASQVDNHVSKYSPTTLKSKIIHGDSVELKESKTIPSVYEAERISPKKVDAAIGPDNVRSSQNCSSNTKGAKLDEWRTATESSISVLDLLGDDGSHGNLEGRSVQEAHVAFSVKGLGKMGMETPVHSPRETGRYFFNGLSPPKAARRFHSSKNHKYITDDLDLELNSIIHDIGMPLDGNSSELTSNSRCIFDHSDYSKHTNLLSKGRMPLDGYGGPKYDFLDQEENFYTNMKGKTEQPWNGRSDFLDRNFLGEWNFGVAWKNQPFQMDSETAKLLRANDQEMFDYGFDDSYVLNRRDEEQEQFKFNTLDAPAPYFKCSTPENNYEFKTFNEERYPAVAGSWGFKSMSNQHPWSYLEKEDARDSISLLSEESCSSSAVKGETSSSAPTFMKLKPNKINHGNEVWRSSGNKHNRKNLYAEKTACTNLHEILREKNLKGAGISMKAPNLSRSKTDHYLNDHSAIQTILEPPRGSVFDKGRTSLDEDSALSPFCKTSVETDTTSLDCKFSSDDLFSPFPIPKLDSNTESSCKRSKFSSPIDFPPSRSFISKKDVLQKSVGAANSYDPFIFADIRSRLRKPNIHQAFKMESQPPCSSFMNSKRNVEGPDVSVQLNVSKDNEDESEFQPTACRITLEEQQKEVSVGNNDFSSENESNVVAADMKDNCGEHKGDKDGTLEPMKSPKTRNYDECVEVPSEEIPEKLDSCNNDKQFHFDPGTSVRSQSENKGIDNFTPERRNTGNKRSSSDESSYQVMLESYVLQLLCVQKVLKEASE